MVHVVATFSDTADRMALYLDGTLIGSVTVNGSLSDIIDINNWLGHSQYFADPDFNGVIHELRIYDSALSASEIADSHAAGPDPL